MPNDLDHERMRFRTMNERQLLARLGKITDRQKLGNFIQVCREDALSSLRADAIRRYTALFGMAGIGRFVDREEVARALPAAPLSSYGAEDDSYRPWAPPFKRELKIEPKTERIRTCKTHGVPFQSGSLSQRDLLGRLLWYCPLCEKRKGIRVIKIKKGG